MHNSTKYIALFRGINVGGRNKVEMPRLKALFDSLGYSNIHTYINSGNILFTADENIDSIFTSVEISFLKEFGFEIPILIKDQQDVINIMEAVPVEWSNNKEQKTDVAYLFPEIDYKEVLNELPVKKRYINLIYTPGAIIWNMDRKNQNKSQLNKLVGHKLYKAMTVRNINTARYLGEWNGK